MCKNIIVGFFICLTVLNDVPHTYVLLPNRLLCDVLFYLFQEFLLLPGKAVGRLQAVFRLCPYVWLSLIRNTFSSPISSSVLRKMSIFPFLSTSIRSMIFLSCALVTVDRSVTFSILVKV